MPNIHSNISFGLVNIPIVMNAIIKDNDATFNQLHDKCLNRIHYIKYCNHCHMEVKEKNIIKGYEYEKDQYLSFSKDELNKLKPERTNEIDIVSFVKESEIDPVYFEKSYFLAPPSKNSKAYDLFTEALKKTKKVALAKTVLGSKFYYCILRFTPSGIILTTLYFREEVFIPTDEDKREVDAKELDLAIKLIEMKSSKFEPQKYKDEYQDIIKKAVKDKLDGKEIKEVKKKKSKDINDLFLALEKSLKQK